MNILLVEDEQAIADTLIYVLTSEGFKVWHVTLGNDVLPTHRSNPFDLIILDIGLPDTTGFEVLKTLRAQPEGQMVPVIFLTARAEEIDRILGLELGADDYVVKPFSPREVASRVRAILRRQARANLMPAATKKNLIWKHDPDAMRIAFHHQVLDLTRYEYLLLALLLSSPGKVFSREQIMNRVWANALETTDRSIDTHIKTIRAKLRAVSCSASASGKNLTISIRDQGSGIAPYAFDRLFERFFSLPRPDGIARSTGLGLPLVREIAHLHGGNVTLTNATEGGAIANLTLPLAN